MNTEIEVRILDIDKDNLISNLEENNAEFIGDWLQVRYVYDFNPVLPNKWIRLRTNGITNTLTIKEKKDYTEHGTKELEIEVSSIEDTDKILEELGYKKRSVQENKRVRYMLNGVEIDIDSWPGINTYAEFESDSLDKIKEVISLLGYNYEDATTDDAQDIYMSQGYTQEDLNNLKFEENA